MEEPSQLSMVMPYGAPGVAEAANGNGPVKPVKASEHVSYMQNVHSGVKVYQDAPLWRYHT